MSEPFLAEVRIVGFNFAPRGWALCDGQLLPISQNQALYSLLGTTYGGDGRTTFGLPDLRGRVPIHVSEQHRQGTKGGVEQVALQDNQLPQHTHSLNADNSQAADQKSPGSNAVLGNSAVAAYAAPGGLVPMHPVSVGKAGGGQPHNNLQPFLALNFCIALQGLFPSRN